MLAACNNTNETNSADETPEDSNQTESNDAGENSDTVKSREESQGSTEAVEEDYAEEQVSGDYLIYGEWLEGTGLLLYFTRTTEDLTREDRIHQSLKESDPSQRDLFSAMDNFEIDGTTANLYFNEDDDLSMASTESAQFWEALNEIGFRYGLEKFDLFNQEGERELTFAEGYWEEPVEIEQEPNRGYYVMSPEKTEQGEYTYISGAVAEEEIYTEDDELLDFGQTVEAMETVKNGQESYHSGIYEGLEIEEAMIDGNQAVVKYHINDGAEASQEEREDFEQVIQLASLDFQVEELKLVNETEQVVSIFPLLDEMDDNTKAAPEKSKDLEKQSDTRGQEENSELTEEDATKIVFDYVDEHENYDREDVKAMVDKNKDDEGYFTVQAFVYAGGEDEVQMTNTIGWYLVDKETGEVEEKKI